MQAQICPPCPNSSGLVEWLPIIVNAILAGIVLWYTLETMWLRKQNQAQLELLKQQGVKSLAPFILPSVSNFTTRLISFADENPIFNLDKTVAEQTLRQWEYKAGVKYIGTLESLTDALALNVRLYVFESKSGTFLKGTQGCPFLQRENPVPTQMRIDEAQKALEFIPKPSGVKIEIRDDPFSSELLMRELERDYSPNEKLLMREVMSDTRSSFILATYTDVEGNPYLIRRRFTLDEKDLIRLGPAVRVGPTFSLPSR
ncbi:MAG TPA: hypothetical protein VLL54_15635 [Pyrinomonadaceae bacterium]|nr:hypothetical protein [Pyrinomonadaceae bacterium]